MQTKAKPNTRELVSDAAWALISKGVAPSKPRVRDRIGARGSDATVVDELRQFWGELGGFVTEARSRPQIPAAFVDAFELLIEQARAVEAQRWQDERDAAQRLLREATCTREASEQARQALETQIVELELAGRELERRLEQGHLQRTRDERTIEAQAARCEALQAQVTDRDRQLEQHRKDTAQELSLSYARAQETEDRLTGIYEGERTAREALEAARVREREQRARVEQALVSVRAELDRMQAVLKNHEQVVAEFHAGQIALGIARQQLDTTRDEVTNLQQQLVVLRDELSEARTASVTAESAVGELRLSAQQRAEEIEALRTALDAVRSRLARREQAAAEAQERPSGE